MNLGLNALRCLLACASITLCAAAEEPTPVVPSSGSVGDLPRAPAEEPPTPSPADLPRVPALPAPPALTTHRKHALGKRLDRLHDLVYRRLQHFLERMDTKYADITQTPIVVPLSPLRIGLDSELLRRQGKLVFAATPDFEATVRLPNIERRLRLFITSNDLPESPTDPALEHNPVLAGLRFAPRAHLDFDLGVRVKVLPSAFAALRWTPEFGAGATHVYPFAKLYLESGVGLGMSGGFTLDIHHGLWIARSSSYADWVRNVAATDWSQTFVVGFARAVIREQRYDRLASGHDLACGAVARIAVSGKRTSHVSVYETSVLFKRPLRGGWLFAYVEPVVRWERAYAWHSGVGFRIGFDALLWGLAEQPTETVDYCR